MYRSRKSTTVQERNESEEIQGKFIGVSKTEILIRERERERLGECLP